MRPARMTFAASLLWATLFFLCLMPAYSYFIMEDRTYAPQATAIAEKIGNLFVEKRICTRERKVCRGYYFTVDYIRGGVELRVLGVEDKDVLMRVEEIIMDQLKSNPKIERIKFSGYRVLSTPKAFEPVKKGKLLFEKEFKQEKPRF